MDQICDKYTITSAIANSKVVISPRGGAIMRVTINTTSAQALTFYDDKTATSPTGAFAVIKASVAEQTFEYRAALTKGLVVDVPASYTGNATVSFIVAHTN